MNPFDELLKELSSLLGITLHRDQFDACCLQIGETLKVHIAQDKKDHIALFAFLEELGPGKFREEVLKEGLKANSLLLSSGILGFSGKNGFLSLHQLWPVETLTAAKLFETFQAFIDYATQWQTALTQGKTSPLTLVAKSSAPSPFGLKP